MWNQMSRLRVRQMELTLQIVRGDIDVAHGHLWIGMAEQLHERGQGYAGTNHFTRVCVPKLVRNDAAGDTDGSRDFLQTGPQLFD